MKKSRIALFLVLTLVLALLAGCISLQDPLDGATDINPATQTALAFGFIADTDGSNLNFNLYLGPNNDWPIDQALLDSQAGYYYYDAANPITVTNANDPTEVYTITSVAFSTEATDLTPGAESVTIRVTAALPATLLYGQQYTIYVPRDCVYLSADGGGSSLQSSNNSITSSFSTLAAPIVLGVTASPAAADVVKGQTQQFTAEVMTDIGVDSAAAVDWSVNSALSTIDAAGLLTVSPDETATALTVTATLASDPAHTSSATVTVKDVFTITASAGANGSISPSGAVTVVQGQPQTFTFAPNNGYELDAVLLNGQAVTASTNSYTLNDVQANATIEVSFKQIPTRTATTPLTGDPADIWIWALLMGAAITAVAYSRRKSKQK